MSSPTETIDRFYRAFAKRDAATMAACYADDARFSDPVFTELHGKHIGNMWRMLCERGTDLVVEHSAVKTEGDTGSAHWEAHYTFSATGKKVHNKIDATFRFRGDKIIEHVDRFDLYAWTKMALGLTGLILGWTPIIRNKVRRTAASGLAAFERKNGLV